jgi:hypothetical protein
MLLLAAAWMPAAGAPSASDSQAAALDKIEPLVLEELAASGRTDFFIWMVKQADLSPAYQLQTKQEKGRFVYETLRETAKRTQQELRWYLDLWGVDYRPFYIANKILVRGGSRALVQEVTVRADVARITANHEFQLDEPEVDPPSQRQILSVEPNISFVNADDVWALGITGQGIVLANSDTGLQWDHPALIDRYRGWDGATVDHNYNWWDATGTFTTTAGDDHGHGTHTTGIMVGDEGGSNQVGMAPGATTIHCKNMTSGGTGTDVTFTECFQWDLAPWDLNGENANPDLAPDAINNSWGYEGGNEPLFKDEIAALHAAGILVEVSAGNEGLFSCSSLRSPGDYAEVLTTGSVNHGSTYPGTVAWLSSRGPSALDPGYFPDVIAPGEGIRSSMPGDGYGIKSGTSMAGPHAVGLVGLMWSACPNLRGQIEDTMQIIQDTAVPLTGQTGWNCGGNYSDGPNNDWGHGTINALAAVQACLPSSVESVAVTGPATGTVDVTYAFTATVAPVTASQPITYTWWSTTHDPVTHTAGLSDTNAFGWSTAGTQTITVTAANAGGTATGTHVITILQSHDIALSTGWTLVSWPLALVTENLTDTLAASCSACDQAWAYDAWDDTDPWRHWPGDLEQADETVGLWLHATEPATLTVTGWQLVNPTIELRAGWNLVGYPSQTAQPVAEALSSIAGKYTRVLTFNVSDPTDPWKQHSIDAPTYTNDLGVIEPGRGYWLHVTEDCTWTVEP